MQEDDLINDYLAFEFYTEGFYEVTEYESLECQSLLMIDKESNVLVCKVCGQQYKEGDS
jgi:uncharacterized protein YbaR (Trm112 family)